MSNITDQKRILIISHVVHRVADPEKEFFMIRKAVIISLVALAIGITFWLKPSIPRNAVVKNMSKVATDIKFNILLFADPREATSNCACAEIIRIARSANDIPGVSVVEYNPFNNPAEVDDFSVRVSPTVIIRGSDGNELSRFEGEALSVIKKLRSTIEDLHNKGEIK